MARLSRFWFQGNYRRMPPRVSIGFPVYNGEKYVREAVATLLAQTFTDFEMVIVDNASTDGTTDICREFAASDPRVRYHRNPTNIGGGPNWNLAFELAGSAPYFKWAAHDDLHSPTIPGEVRGGAGQRSEHRPGLHTRRLDRRRGQDVARRERCPCRSTPRDPCVRFESILPSYDCLEIFGVIRREALPPPPVMGLYPDGDGVLLARIALAGRFYEVPEVLFSNRRHATQAGTRFDGNARGWAVWWNPENEGRRVFPQWRRQTELWRALAGVPLNARDRLRCAYALARWTNNRRHRLYEDVAFHAREVLASWRRTGS